MAENTYSFKPEDYDDIKTNHPQLYKNRSSGKAPNLELVNKETEGGGSSSGGELVLIAPEQTVTPVYDEEADEYVAKLNADVSKLTFLPHETLRVTLDGEVHGNVVLYSQIDGCEISDSVETWWYGNIITYKSNELYLYGFEGTTTVKIERLPVKYMNVFEMSIVTSGREPTFNRSLEDFDQYYRNNVNNGVAILLETIDDDYTAKTYYDVDLYADSNNHNGYMLYLRSLTYYGRNQRGNYVRIVKTGAIGWTTSVPEQLNDYTLVLVQPTTPN